MILRLCEQCEGPIWVSSGATAGAGDVAGASQAVTADREVSQGGHDRGPVAGADLGKVLAEGDIADPVQ